MPIAGIQKYLYFSIGFLLFNYNTISNLLFFDSFFIVARIGIIILGFVVLFINANKGEKINKNVSIILYVIVFGLAFLLSLTRYPEKIGNHSLIAVFLFFYIFVILLFFRKEQNILYYFLTGYGFGNVAFIFLGGSSFISRTIEMAIDVAKIDPNHYAISMNLLLFSIPFFSEGVGSWKNNCLRMTCVVYAIYGLLISASRGAISAFILGAIVFLIISISLQKYKTYRIYPIFYLAAMLIGIAVVLSSYSGIIGLYYKYRFSLDTMIGTGGSGRIPIWIEALDAIKRDIPFIGYGAGNFQQYLAKHGLYSSAHNMFLQMAVELGIPFAIVTMIIIITACFKVLKINILYLPLIVAMFWSSIFLHSFFDVTFSIFTVFLFYGMSRAGNQREIFQLTGQAGHKIAKHLYKDD